MTTTNNFVCFEEVTVSKTRKGFSYIVHLDMEGYTFYIDKEIVEDISTKSQEDENLIAIILAYIEYVRKCRNADNSRKAKSLEEKLLITGVLKHLEKYPREKIIEIIRNLRWHEICKVWDSDNPIEELEEII